MRPIRGLLAVVLALPLLASEAAGQGGGTLSGRVTDETTGQPLAGVSVTVVGTTQGVLTDEAGRYVLVAVPAGAQQLRAALIGYAQSTQTVTVVAGRPTTQDFSLRPSAVELAGIVVTATGQEQRRREIGNAVTQIQADELQLAPIQEFSDILQGRAAGVTVLPSSGTAGSGSRIRIRGNSSVSLDATPLVIIDGIRVNNTTEDTGLFTGGTSTSRFEDLNPEDIESLEILKGPAASALYGTAAANGVIQITTKRGQAGRTQIRTYAERATMSIPDDFIPTNYRAVGFRSDLDEVGDCSYLERSEGLCEVETVHSFNPLLQAPGSPLGTGRQDKLGVSVSGGSPGGEVTYFVAAETEGGPGVMRDNELDRQSFRANLSGQVSETFRISAHSGFVTSYIQLPQEGNTGSGAWLNALLDADPSPENVERGGGFSFPYSAETVGWWKNQEDLRRFTGSVSADWRPNSWLHFNAVTGVDQANRFERSLIAPPGLPTGSFTEGLREQYRTQDREFTANLNSNITRALRENLNSTTAFGVQYNETNRDWSYVAGAGLAPGTLTPSEALSVEEFYGETKLFGIYGSQQFALNDRLFLTAAIRGDQNSAFGENIGFVTYPAFSASWVVLEEPWFPETGLLSNLRLRAAYGESGQRPGRLDAVRTYTTQAVAIEGAIRPGFIVSNAGNPNLEPEVSEEVELGADLGFFEDRVALEVTHYDKTTTNALVQRPLPPSIGGPDYQFFNLGEVENRGWEAALRLEPIRRENVGLDLGVTFTTNRNRLVTFGDSTIPPVTIGLQRHVAGYPLGGYWTIAYEYDDANADGIIQADEVQVAEEQTDADAERSYLGSPFPKREISFSGDAQLLGMFRLTGLLDYKGGHKLYNWGRRLRCGSVGGAYCAERQVPGEASLEEQAAMMAALELGTGAGFVEDADFWKLRELSLTFTTPQSWLARSGLRNQGLSVTLSGRNLKTWTDYGGPDPEVSIPGSVAATDDPGDYYTVDLYSLPAPRIWTVRVDVNF